MGDDTPRLVPVGQKALVIGVANEDSIAYGCAKGFRATGADLASTWLTEKARPSVEPLARELGASITGAVDVAIPGQLEAMFDQIRTKWGRLDILVHLIAFAPKSDLQGGLLNCSAEGFAKAPIMVTSRADNDRARLAPCALAQLYEYFRREGRAFGDVATAAKAAE